MLNCSATGDGTIKKVTQQVTNKPVVFYFEIGDSNFLCGKKCGKVEKQVEKSMVECMEK